MPLTPNFKIVSEDTTQQILDYCQRKYQLQLRHAQQFRQHIQIFDFTTVQRINSFHPVIVHSVFANHPECYLYWPKWELLYPGSAYLTLLQILITFYNIYELNKIIAPDTHQQASFLYVGIVQNYHLWLQEATIQTSIKRRHFFKRFSLVVFNDRTWLFTITGDRKSTFEQWRGMCLAATSYTSSES